jgi:deaminated glutathione amidase
MRAAAIQLNSRGDKEANLRDAERHVRAAAADGAQLIVLPERMNVRGTDEDYAREAEPLDGPAATWAASLAQELEVDLVAGSITERREGHDKLSNTSLHFGPDGELKGAYRKIHLFDVTVGEIGYRESASGEAGEEIVTSDAADGTRVGLSVCYDLRFPELYRILALHGARVLTIPANFTKPTGEAHWEVLIRARAIENQVFAIAAAQVGAYPEAQGPTYGNSMIVDPWGVVLARADGESTGFIAAELDFARQDEVREKLPSLAHRVPDAYRWPVEAPV